LAGFLLKANSSKLKNEIKILFPTCVPETVGYLNKCCTLLNFTGKIITREMKVSGWKKNVYSQFYHLNLRKLKIILER
jgi:hypothetical protein